MASQSCTARRHVGISSSPPDAETDAAVGTTSTSADATAPVSDVKAMARQMYQQKNGAKDTATTKASAIAEDGTYDISKEFGTSLADLDEGSFLMHMKGVLDNKDFEKIFETPRVLGFNYKKEKMEALDAAKKMTRKTPPSA